MKGGVSLTKVYVKEKISRKWGMLVEMSSKSESIGKDGDRRTVLRAVPPLAVAC